ncbi:MAG: lipopolysaccharide biosynthesis protein [Phycisphaerae bacterium]
MTGSLFRDSGKDTALGRRTAHAGAFTLLTQLLVFLTGFGRTVILARLLQPEDFGLVAMVLVFVSLLHTCRNAGFGMPTIQHSGVTQAQISTMFWITGAAGVLLAGALAALGPVLAWVYGRQELTAITVAYAVFFVLPGFSLQHQALLERNLRFGRLALVRIGANLLGSSIAVLMAWTGWGYWSLVAFHGGDYFGLLVGGWIASGWIPGLPRRNTGVRSMLHFGRRLGGVEILNAVARNTDKFLVGRFLGDFALGLYSKAYELLMLPVRMLTVPLTKVAIPALSRLREQPDKYRQFYYRGIRLFAMLSIPVPVVLFLLAHEIVFLLLGPKWLPMVPIFRILTIAMLADSFDVSAWWVFISRGEGGRLFRAIAAFSVALVAACLIGLQWGVQGVAWAVAVTMVFARILILFYCYRKTPLRLARLFKVLSLPFFSAMVAGACAWAAGWALGLTDWLRVVGVAGVYAAAYVAQTLMIPSLRQEVTNTAKLMLRRGRPEI